MLSSPWRILEMLAVPRVDICKCGHAPMLNFLEIVALRYPSPRAFTRSKVRLPAARSPGSDREGALSNGSVQVVVQQEFKTDGECIFPHVDFVKW